MKQKEYSWSSVPEGGKNGTKGSWDPNSKLAGSFCCKLDPYQFNTPKLQPWGWGVSEWEHCHWGHVVPENLFLESPNLSRSPSARTSLYNERPAAPSVSMAVEPGRPAAEVVPPVPMQS